MKLLLTSNGISNKKLAQSLRALLGKPFARSRMVFVPTAANISPNDKGWLINDLYNCQKLGFNELNILNIDATPQEKLWRPRLEAADVILFGGGNVFYLMHWLKKSGLARALPQMLKNKIYVGISAGSIAAAPTLALSSVKKKDLYQLYYEKEPRSTGAFKGLGLVNFHVRPHFNSPDFPQANEHHIRHLAQNIRLPIYALDDNSAVEVSGRSVKVVGSGKYLTIN